MATLRVVVEGELGSITAKAFVVAVQNSLSILRDYDIALSGERRGSLDWVITRIDSGSARLEIEPRSRLEEKNVGLEVVHSFVNGWRQIEQGGTTPAYLSPKAMGQVKDIVKLIGKEGTTGFIISSQSEEVEITPKSTVHVERLLRVRHHSIGSVEGRIETVSIHRRDYFMLYHARTRKAIMCTVPKGKVRELVPTDILGTRVIVFGILHSNDLGEVLRINVERIRQLGTGKELPSYTTLGGSDPAFTGDLATEEFVRSIRGD